ncbi:MAG: hypothetical protein QNJ67_06040 [Kiloniellales bacterium]|nr:hypothetical protein [Kiloniellales bacterium]
MFSLFRKSPPPGDAATEPASAHGDSERPWRHPKGRVAEVGWMIHGEKSTFIYEAPRAIYRKTDPATPAKAVGFCPAVLDNEARHFEVRCPFDLHLRYTLGPKGNPALINVAGKSSAVAKSVLDQLVKLEPADTWRSIERPVLQIGAPWRFLADEPVYLVQLPPFNHYRDPPLPGTMVTARFPIHIWPRSLMWAFEWWDTSKDLILKRGEPWFYLRFETLDPARSVRLVEAQSTPELQEYCSGLEGVVSYVKKTFDLFKIAEERRPKVLLKKVER